MKFTLEKFSKENSTDCRLSKSFDLNFCSPFINFYPPSVRFFHHLASLRSIHCGTRNGYSLLIVMAKDQLSSDRLQTSGWYFNEWDEPWQKSAKLAAVDAITKITYNLSGSLLDCTSRPFLWATTHVSHSNSKYLKEFMLEWNITTLNNRFLMIPAHDHINFT